MNFNALARSGRLAALAATVTGGALLLSSAATGQDGAHFISVQDDGSGPMVTSFAAPNMWQSRKPDYEPRDLELFDTKLALEDFQSELVKVLLDDYLEAFAELAGSVYPAGEGPQMLTFGFGDEHGEGGAGIGFVMPELDIDVGEIEEDITAGGPGEMRIAITVGTGDGGDGEGGGFVVSGDSGEDGSGGVTIELDTEGEIPEEVREKLQKMAEDMAAQMEERMQQMEEDGELAEHFQPQSIEEFEAHMAEMKQKAERFKKDKEVLRLKFIEDVRALLTDGQLSRWPSLERALTRRKTLPDGRMDGERTDLIEIIEELELSDEQYESLHELMDGYELTLHDALVARNSFVPKAQAEVDESLQSGDSKTALKAVDRATKLRLGVRRVNETYAGSIAAQLGGDAGEAFEQAYLKRSYPRVYGRQTTAQRAFERAANLEGLVSEVQSAIASLSESYELELAPLKEQLRQSIHKHEPNESRRGIEQIAEVMSGEGDGQFRFNASGDENPIRKAFKKRTALDERYMKQLYAMLGEEQVKKLPKLPSERGGPIRIRRLLGHPNGN